ncbi:MAG: helix-turn-helix transcriptional regulator [Brevinematales bacterium]|jgi:DNA-binding CsgD family transcriptional regulator
MEHIVLSLFLLALLSGITFLMLSIHYYIKTKNGLWKYLLFIYCILIVKLLLNYIFIYIKVNLISETIEELFFFKLSSDFTSLVIFINPFLFHRILKIPFMKTADLAAAVPGISALALIFIPYITRLVSPDMALYYYAFDIMQMLLVILAFIWQAALFILYYGRISGGDRKWIAAVLLIFTVFIILDYFFVSWSSYFRNIGSPVFSADFTFLFIGNIAIFVLAYRRFGKTGNRITPESVGKGFIRKFGITERELDIINMIIAGKTNSEIASVLFLSVKTVKNHIYSIYQKTRVRSRIELALLIKKGL